jgi:hypothetical protein
MEKQASPGAGMILAMSARRIACYCVNNLGDMFSTTPAVRALRGCRPDAFIAYVTHDQDYCRILDGNPDIDQILYREDLARRGEGIGCDAWFRSLPLDLGRGLRVVPVQCGCIGRGPRPARRSYLPGLRARAWTFDRFDPAGAARFGARPGPGRGACSGDVRNFRDARHDGGTRPGRQSHSQGVILRALAGTGATD